LAGTCFERHTTALVSANELLLGFELKLPEHFQRLPAHLGGVEPHAPLLPVYRLYLNAFGGLHLWTTDLNEKNVLSTSRGWVYEGVAGYVVPLQ
jgi:hypothetical protein